VNNLKDYLGIIGFVIAVILGAFIINAFLFRTFSVIGPSMENTLHTNDRLIISRLPHTGAMISGKQYVPDRGSIIVFRKPAHITGDAQEYIVKRVIGLPGERVKVEDGKVIVYNKENPKGYEYDKDYPTVKHPSSGEEDVTVPDGEIFVAGDNRHGNFSLDSRNGMGTIPLDNIQGPVVLQFWPFDKFRTF
jgi:signal peptidase I